MKAALVAIVLLAARAASAHRLDEYLQATTLALDKNHVQMEIRLTPGVAVLPFVLSSIDTDGDGVISAAEQQAYTRRVLHDVSLSIDGQPLRLRLESAAFPGMREMKEGLGEIQLAFAADAPGDRRDRKLVFENRHQRPISVYLVNCLVPRDPELRVTAQNRNYEQSFYQLDYQQATVVWWADARVWFSTLGLLLAARLAVLLWRRAHSVHRLTPMAERCVVVAGGK